MAQKFITTVELRQMPASVAVARIFKYSVIHQTPHGDAVLKRHAIMILSGYLEAAMIKAGEPTSNTALVDLVCKLLVSSIDDRVKSRDRTDRILRKLFGIRSEKLEVNRLITSCRPEPHLHGYAQRPSRIKDEDVEVEVIERTQESRSKKVKPPKERVYKTPEEEEAALRSGEWGKRNNRL